MLKRNTKKKDETFLALAMTKVESLTITRYTIAILKGASTGINDILEMCRHPLDQIIYPVSRLIYDATLIAAQHSNSADPDLMLLHQYLQNHPEMYFEAIQRMHQLAHGISNLVNNFSSANGVLRTEMIAHGLTTILVPGYVIKSTRNMIQAARANHLQFGTILQPPVFANRSSKATFESIPQIDITKILQSKIDEIVHYIYIITVSQELRLAKRTRDIPLKNGYQFFHHDDLAGLQSVYAAGEFYVQNGKICSINNASGHYFPVSHASMPSMVELAFQRIGIDVSGLYYAEITPRLSELVNIKSKQLIDFLAQIGLSKPGCVDSLAISLNLLSAANTHISEQTVNMEDALHTQDFSGSHDEDNLERQNVPSVSCIKDRLKHRFVTPHYVSTSELVKENGVLLYAITDKEKLIIARQKSHSLDGKGNIMQTSHMDLTRGKKIISAGMMTVEHGKIIRMEHHSADYEPIHTESITFQPTIERIFSTYGFPEIHDQCIQRPLSHPPQIHAVDDSTLLNQKRSVFPSLRFYPQPIEISSSLGEAPLRNRATSSLAPVDFAARTANFNNIIAKGVSRKRTSHQSAQPTFFSLTSTSGMPTFDVSMSRITDSCSSNDSVPQGSSSKAWTSKPPESIAGIKPSKQKILAWDSDGKPVLISKY